ncbi:MAG: hypothetical protein OEM15_12565 [Myxococcales bacterium]|nr:hypothetical protein [Myxococcales bacterium]
MRLTAFKLVLVLTASVVMSCKGKVESAPAGDSGPGDMRGGSGGAPGHGGVGGDPVQGGAGGNGSPDDFFVRGNYESLETISAYYVGHSLLADIPDIVTHISNQMRSTSFSFRQQNVPGAPLRWHWEQTGPGGAGTVQSGGFTHQIHEAVASGDYSHMIVTDSVPRGGTAAEDETAEYLGKIVAAARQARPDVRLFYYETWPHITSGLPGHDPYNEDTVSPTRHLLWRERIDADAAMWERIVDRVNQENPPGPNGHNVQLIPAGRVLARVVDAVEAGQIQGFDELGDLFLDEIHANRYGQFIVATTHAAIHTRRDPRDFDIDVITRYGSSYWNEEYARPSDAVASAFLQVVYESVPVYYRDR